MVQFGLNDVTDAALDRLETNMTNIEISTDSNTPLVTDTALGGTTLNETAFSTSRTSTSFAVAGFYDATEFNSNTINKAGIKDGSGNLYTSGLTNAIVKTASIEAFIEVKAEVTTTNT